MAEAAKIIENTQRDINIAFINELSIIFNKLNIDIYILSKEKNEAAKQRALKLQLACFLGVNNKLKFTITKKQS